MLKICSSFIYKFDMIGPIPQLMIFNKIRYQSLISSIISFLIFLFSVFFAIFSAIEFLKFKNPNIAYTKANDIETQRSIYIKDTPLMLQLMDSSTMLGVDKSVKYFVGQYNAIYDNGTFSWEDISIENCQFGKNIDIKYKEFFNDKYKFGRNIEDLYCLNLNSNMSALFYNPNIGSNSLDIHVVLYNNSNYLPEKLQTLIISESDLIDHNNKENPINKNYIYQSTGGFNSLEYSRIYFNFKYVKYESDDGLFYNSEKLFNGMSFADMSYFKNIEENYDLKENFKKYGNSRIGTITFSINKSNYDNYKRNYKKVQSLLAEIMSVVSLLFEIGRQAASILIRKKMSSDIVNNLIINEKKNELVNKSIKVGSFNSIIKNDLSTSERKKVLPELVDKVTNVNSLEKNNQINFVKKDENKEIFEHTKFKQAILNSNEKTRKINYFNIIKSYLCFKDEKSKIINLFHNIINEDTSVEKILERFYNLENLLNSISNKEKEKKKVKIVKSKEKK